MLGDVDTRQFEDEPDYFADMAPQIKKAEKATTKKQLSSRLQPIANPEVSTTAWNAEDDLNLDDD